MGRNWSEMILAVFRGEDPKGVVWQPRIDFWFLVNQKRGTLPKRYEGATLLDVHDDVKSSIRYFIWPLRTRYTKVKVEEQWVEPNRLLQVWKTPVGELREVLRFTHYGLSAYHEEFKVKTPEDLRVLEYILEDSE
jgi:hypothetical protein